jgi:hypothetical protein
VERLRILPIDAPKTKEIESTTIVERRATSQIHAPTHVLSSTDTVIYFSTTTQPASKRKGESTSKGLKTDLTTFGWLLCGRLVS